MADNKVNPDDLLRAITERENRSKKGQLKIFLGMAAGVGKTYAMLEEAQIKTREGVNLLVASIYTHGRQDTAKLVEGLNILPEKSITYKDTVFKELDLDEILRIKPQLVLVDELAHTNIPGSRHPKRWQDVVEILDAGIDVYTTLNIQHLESRKEIVERIAQIRVTETVPDLIIEMASEVELIDLTPGGLLQRLKEGKVYTGDLTEIAAVNFFQEDRLTALREMSLRFTAEKVDHELHSMVSSIQQGKEWKISDKLLVAINHHPSSQQLIRTARRLAFGLDAPWVALHIDQGEDLDEDEKNMLNKNLTLARELGGEVITTADSNIAEGIQRIAQQKASTLIVIGKSLKKKITDFFSSSGSLDRFISESSDIDIYIVRQPFFSSHKKKKTKQVSFSKALFAYLPIFLWLAAVSVFNALIYQYVGYQVVGFVFLIGILAFSLFTKRGLLIVATFLSALTWMIFFVPFNQEKMRFSEEDTAFFVLFFVSALILGILMNRIKANRELLIKREQSTAALYEIVREIASAPSSQILKGIKDKIEVVLKGACEIIIQRIDRGLVFEETSSIMNDEKEKAVATWVFKNGKEAGWSTSTISSAKNLYVPLKGFRSIVGVLAYRPIDDHALLPEEMNFLSTVSQQLANYLERSFTEEKERKQHYYLQIEKIYEKILQVISQELQKPLWLIQEAVVSCKKENVVSENSKLNASFQTIEKSLGNLMKITENASDMAKLSAGLMTFQKLPHDVKDLIDTCCKKVELNLKEHRLQIIIAPNLQPIAFDFDLLEILLNNFLSNAVDYTPPNTLIQIEADVFDRTFVLSVSDEGSGIPDDMMDLVFEKFYRVPGTAASGLGLGLAIAKSIAEIHNGYIKAQNRKPRGAKFSLILPIP